MPVAVVVLVLVVAVVIEAVAVRITAATPDFTVNSTADVLDASPGDGACNTGNLVGGQPECTLRAAVQESNALGGAQTIEVPSGTYSLTRTGMGEDFAVTGDLDLRDDVTITGSGAGSTIIDAGGNGRVFELYGTPAVTLTAVTVSNCFEWGNGSCIYVGANTTATLDSILVTGGAQTPAITSYGTLTLIDSRVTGNTSNVDGAGVYSYGTLTISGSTIDANTSTGRGGGVFYGGWVSPMSIENSTISGNHASSGGGVYNDQVAVFTNVTITGNTATGNGGGVYEPADSATNVFLNTIVAGNSASTSPDVAGSMTSSGYNVIGNVTGSSGWVGSDQQNTNPALAPLADNGGPTPTHAIGPTSAAADAGTSSGAPTVDQRGEVRDASPDVGAYEYVAPTPESVVLDRVQHGTVVLTGTSATATIDAVDMSRSFLTFTVRGSANDPEDIWIGGRLSNATTLTFDRYDNTGTMTVEWSVAEFTSGVSVQRGVATVSAVTTDVAISPVDLGTSFPLVHPRSNGAAFNADDFVRGALTSSTNLRLTVGSVGTTVVPWQIVTYDEAVVQSGSVSFGTAASSATASITAVDPAKAWLTYSVTSGDLSGDNIGQALYRGRLTNSTTLTFDRSNTGIVGQVHWYLVEFTDATEVQSGTAAFADATTTVDVGITSVNTGRAIVTGGYLGYGGRTSLSASEDPGAGWFTATFTAADVIQLQRGTAPATADLGWFVIHWPCLDSDGDGLCDDQEDADSDADGDPSTTPGPDTDGDTTPNYLDADDDGDGMPTASEQADPDGDGDPRDARDADHDGQPDYLDAPTIRAWTPLAAQQKISDTAGGLVTALGTDDRLGRAATSVGDLDGDGVVDIAVGAPYDDDGGFDRGAVFVLFLNANGTVKAEQKISDTVGGFGGVLDNSDLFGTSVAAAGDVDGDGIGDLLVGAIGDDDGWLDRGAVWVLFLNANGTVRAHQKISDTVGGFVGVLNDSDFFGSEMAPLGDLDGDGLVDVAVTAIYDDDGGTDRGAIYVLFLNADGTVKAEQKISDTVGGFAGAMTNDDRLGFGIDAVGDLDGDGVTELVVGVPFDDVSTIDQGAVYVLFLNADGTVKAEQKIAHNMGGFGSLDASDWFGYSVAALGDLDGDGRTDIAVGAPLDDDGGADRGAVYLITLGAAGTATSSAKISDTAGGFTGVIELNDFFGATVTGIGDQNANQTPGLVVGAYDDDDGGSNHGAVYVLDLSPANAAPTADPGGPYAIDEGDGLVLDGSGSTDPDGDTLTYAWDLDGDSIYGDVTGAAPTVSWTTLQSLGLDDDGSFTIGLLVDDGNGETAWTTTTLTIANVAPTISVTGSATATVGVAYAVSLGVTDPGDDTVAGWTINWGDGTIDTLIGNPTSASHTYLTAAGLGITGSVTDEDGTWTDADLVVPGLEGTSTLARYDGSTGAFRTALTGPPSVTGSSSAEVGPDGLLYVANFTAGEIYRFDPATNGYLGVFASGLDQPAGFVWGPGGDLLVGEYGDAAVGRYDAGTGEYIDDLVAAGSGGLSQPTGVLLGSDGNVYVADASDGAVRRYDAVTGAFVDVFAATAAALAYDIEWGPDGHLYVAVGSQHRVARFDGTSGAFIDDIVGAASGGLNTPMGIEFGPDGDLYVSSSLTDEVKRYDAASGAYLGNFVSAGSGGIDEPALGTFLVDVAVTVAPNAVPIADAGGPYAIASGDSVALDGSGSSDAEGDPITYSWDLDGDQVYGDVIGVSPTVTWATLQSYGITGAGDHQIGLEVDDVIGGSSRATTWITVSSNVVVVNSTADLSDVVPGDGRCTTGQANADGKAACTLRAAIEEANASATVDAVHFAIPTTDSGYSATNTFWTIEPSWTFDPTAAVTIDATTQPGYADEPQILLLGTSAAGGTDGFEIAGDGVTIRGFAIASFPGAGIYIPGTSDGATIESSYIGTDVTGTAAMPHTWEGIFVDGATNVTIGGVGVGNLISGNANSAVGLDGVVGAAIVENRIGTTADGSTALPNAIFGINAHLSTSVTIDGNVISGNDSLGVIVGGSTDTVLVDNLIGTDATGLAAVPNGSDGVFVNDASTGTVIGQPGAGNVISGNSEDGIEIVGTSGTVVQGNTIGLGLDGDTPVANGRAGIVLYDGVGTTEIGGSGAGEGNVISGNTAAGVLVNGASNPAATANVLQGNLIGTDTTGSLDRGNGSHGIEMFGGTSSTLIGGTEPGAGNRVAFNAGDGIAIADGDGHAIVGNQIVDNGGIGIDLAGGGPTANDGGDGDTGANGLLNFPVLTSAVDTGPSLELDVSIDVPAGTYRVEVFVNPSGADPTGYGEGETLVGVTTVTVSGGGSADLRLTARGGLGDTLTATITEDLGGGSYGSTSEFSASITATAGGVVRDASVRRADLVAVGGLDVGSPGPGRVAAGIDLAGGTERLAGPALDVTSGALTLSGWIHPDSLTGESRLVSKRPVGGGAVYELLVDGASGEAVARMHLGGADVEARGGTVGTGDWHQVTATWDGTTVRLYVDAVEVDAVAAAGPLGTDLTARVVVGNAEPSGAGVDGSIDQIEIEHVARSAAWVETEFLNLSDPTRMIAIGAVETSPAGSWATTTTTVHSGSHALSAPVTGSGSDAWAVVAGLDEPGLAFEAWWYVADPASTAVAAGTNTGAVATDQRETLATGGGFDLGSVVGPTRTVDAPPTSTVPTAMWTQVEIRTDETGASSVWLNGVQIIAPTTHSTGVSGGSAGLRVGTLTSADGWLIDDVLVRRYVSAEPVASLGPFDRQ